jgi:hypothetical protein
VDIALPWPLALALIVAGQFFTYLVTRRRFSGRVEGTDAEQLWDEQREYRQKLERRLKYLEDHKVPQLEQSLSDEKLIRRFEGMKCRVSNHALRNEVMTMQFLSHPEVPDDIKESVLARQKAHTTELEMELQELEKELRERGLAV